MAVKPVPDRYHTVTPYLTVQGVPKLIDFVKRVFDATELERMSRPDGTIGHAEVRIGVMRSGAREIAAHAWVESNGHIVIGDLPGLSGYAPLPPLPTGAA